MLPEGRMALSCYKTSTVSFINKEGVELFQIVKKKKHYLPTMQFILKITIAMLYHPEGKLKDA